MNISSTSTKKLNSDPEVLVKVDNVGKIFCRDLKKSLLYGVRDSLRDLAGRRKTGEMPGERSLRKGEFWANKGVSFELRRGECLGLIGHNGAGKTTLLKMLNGLIKPDTGSIEMRGKIGALIALGAGFNPILTGRENIYINGSILGLEKKYIDGKIDEIIDFAELSEFIDSPVQTYSSGMQVRLGFAVSAVMIKPDILILDEVLAVGDISFKVKCYNVIDQLRRNSAVILVSHSLEHISRITDRCLVLDRGETNYIGATESALPIYKSLSSCEDSSEAPAIYTTGVVTDISGPEHPICQSRDIEIPFDVTLEKPCQIRMRAVLAEPSLKIVAEMRDLSSPEELPVGVSTLVLRIPNIQLQAEKYALYMNIYDQEGNFIATSGKVTTLEIEGKTLGECSYQPDADIALS
jgi:lipopolysaccharide transport system ATP-binding protein